MGFHPLKQRPLRVANAAAELLKGRSVTAHPSFGQPRLAQAQEGGRFARREQALKPGGGLWNVLLRHWGVPWTFSIRPRHWPDFESEKLPGGFSQKESLTRAASGLIPTGAAGLDGLAPAVLEAANRYTESPSAGLLELGFRVSRVIRRGLHLLKQILITVAFRHTLWEWPDDNAKLGQVRYAEFRRVCL